MVPPGTGSVLADPTGLDAFDSLLASGRLPGRLEELVEDYLAVKTGRTIGDGVILDRLRRAIVAQKSGYWREGRRREISRAGHSVLVISPTSSRSITSSPATSLAGSQRADVSGRGCASLTSARDRA